MIPSLSKPAKEAAASLLSRVEVAEEPLRWKGVVAAQDLIPCAVNHPEKDLLRDGLHARFCSWEIVKIIQFNFSSFYFDPLSRLLQLVPLPRCLEKEDVNNKLIDSGESRHRDRKGVCSITVNDFTFVLNYN